jgi:flagellar basal-body rod protein FlgF
VRPRALEGSNVSAVEEMVATMSLNRSFEAADAPVQGQRQA